ncbi:hypothetical protein KJ865_05875 [Myxococcota bacterium]|nr:hypothetical protein [Myxococcota bacterium]
MSAFASGTTPNANNTMKILFIILLSVFVFSCEEDNCYKFGTTKEACESKSNCRFRTSAVSLIVDDSPTEWMEIILRGWDPNFLTNSRVGICIDKDNKVSTHQDDKANEKDSGGYQSNTSWCYRFMPSLMAGLLLPLSPSSDWIRCSELAESMKPDSLPVCGNGIIELGEQCDTDQLGTMPDCATHAARLNKGPYTSGVITCTPVTCQWDYSQCQ